MNPETRQKHKELLALIAPLIEFMDENEVSYFLVAGKDEICSRYMRGFSQDIAGMIEGMVEENESVAEIIKACAK